MRRIVDECRVDRQRRALLLLARALSLSLDRVLLLIVERQSRFEFCRCLECLLDGHL